MYDLVHLYLAVLDAISADKVTMVGFSFGGWIAAEVAACAPAKLDRLVLVDKIGVKLGGREERDIAHFFDILARGADPTRLARPGATAARQLRARLADGDQRRDQRRGPDHARPQLGCAVPLCLAPHMYNPQLKYWLHRIAVPTLVLWGRATGS